MPARRLFHGFIAVAPLKHAAVGAVASVSIALFHGFIAVAPLKPDRLTRRSRDGRRLFHGFIAVAPLKPRCVSDRHARLIALPRLHRRGPIEASALRGPGT